MRKSKIYNWRCELFHHWNLIVTLYSNLAYILENFLQVMRGGRTVKISIFDIVVGDVVPLRIGDQVSVLNVLVCSTGSGILFIKKITFFIQVPADGILITGHSLAIDESSMTGESKIVSDIPCSSLTF